MKANTNGRPYYLYAELIRQCVTNPLSVVTFGHNKLWQWIASLGHHKCCGLWLHRIVAAIYIPGRTLVTILINGDHFKYHEHIFCSWKFT